MKKIFFIFVSVAFLVNFIGGFVAHEGTHWIQGTQHAYINPGEFQVQGEQIGWNFQWDIHPTLEQVNQFLTESAIWENEALFVQLILTPLITILMFPGLALLEVHRCAS